MECRTLICVDSENKRNLEKIGLSIDFVNKNCALIESNGEKARSVARQLKSDSKVFVISSDDFDAINLAAAIKHDDFGRQVYLAVNNLTGSLRSRTEACHLDDVLDYSHMKSLIERRESQHIIFENEPQPRNFEFEENFEVEEPFTSSSSLVCQPFLNYDSDVGQKRWERSDSSCWIMSVFSGSGGAGKSVVSALSSQLFCSLGYKTLLIDFDLQFGDLKSSFKGAKFEELDRIAKNTSQLETSFDFEGEFPFILSAPSRLEMCEVVAPKVEEIVSLASHLADVIIINTGSCWSDIHANLMKSSSMSLFLIDQRVSSVRGCKHAVDLASRLNISSQSFKFALNRCYKKSILSTSDVAPAFGGAEVIELSEGGIDVEEKMCLGCAIDLVKQKNPLATSLFEMLKVVCPLSFDKSKESTHQKKRDKR